MALTLTLTTDGSSDQVLTRYIEWIAAERLGEVVWARPQRRSSIGDPLSSRLVAAVERYPCDLLVVHRDAERDPADKRFAEIEQAAEHVSCPVVPLVPVRMTEAWLLFDEKAIRLAAGNPNGTSNLSLPPISRCSSVTNPKETLWNALKTASERTGRRLKKFRPARASLRVADYIDDFAPLRGVTEFQRFEEDLKQAMALCLGK